MTASLTHTEVGAASAAGFVGRVRRSRRYTCRPNPSALKHLRVLFRGRNRRRRRLPVLFQSPQERIPRLIGKRPAHLFGKDDKILGRIARTGRRIRLGIVGRHGLPPVSSSIIRPPPPPPSPS